MEQPINEMYPELNEGWKSGVTWDTAPEGAKRAEMCDLVEKLYGVAVHINGETPDRVVDNLGKLLEWTLRHKKVHPDLPVVPASLKKNRGILLD